MPRSSRRLFNNFSWPPRSLKDPLLLATISEKCFKDVLEALAASNRLQEAICSLQLGSYDHNMLSRSWRPAYRISIPVLISILDICTHLDDIVIMDCCLQPACSAVEPDRLGGLEKVTFVRCPMDGGCLQDVLQMLSSFIRIDTLVVTHGQFAFCLCEKAPMPLLPRLLELREFSWAGISPSMVSPLALAFFKQLETISNIRPSLRSVTVDSIDVECAEYLQHLSCLESLSYLVQRDALKGMISPVANLTFLRHLTLWGVNRSSDERLWSCIMRDIEHISPHLRPSLQYLGVSIDHMDTWCYTESESLEIVRNVLSGQDWRPMERFIERHPLVTVEIQIQCWRGAELDPERLQSVIRETISRCLSSTAVRAVSVRSPRP